MQIVGIPVVIRFTASHSFDVKISDHRLPLHTNPLNVTIFVFTAKGYFLVKILIVYLINL